MINVFGSKVGKEELDEIKTSIEAQWLGIGKKTEIFESLIRDKIGNPFIAIDNCSNGLYMALKILNLPKGSDVIVPTITWISCANAVITAGYRPIFADCDYETINVTNETLEKVKTRKTRCAIIVHYAGFPCLAGSYLGVPVIADCAHAIDSYVSDMHVNYWHDINVYSFDSMKNIACGELGGISSFNQSFIETAKALRYCGIEKSGLQAAADKTRWWEYQCHIPFIKMLPNDISSSIGIAQFKKLDSLQKIRKRIWNIYKEQLSCIGWILNPPEIPKGIKHSYFTYYIRVLNGRRDELAKYLLDKGIYTTVRYQPLHLMKCFGSKQKLPISEKLNEQLLNIPLHPNLTDKNLEYIIDSIKKFKGLKK